MFAFVSRNGTGLSEWEAAMQSSFEAPMLHSLVFADLHHQLWAQVQSCNMGGSALCRCTGGMTSRERGGEGCQTGGRDTRVCMPSMAVP